MTLAKDKSKVEIGGSNLKDIMLHYLHPDFVDDRSAEVYSNSRCPLSMLAETCKNIGKLVQDTPLSQSRDSNVSLSPSCSSSCSAPKFSPHSAEYSPNDITKVSDDYSKEKNNQDKLRKRKAVRGDPNDVLEKRISSDQNGLINSPYTISEFLKLNNMTSNLGKEDFNSLIHPFYNQLFNHPLQSPSMWSSKSQHQSGMPPFPADYRSSNNSYPINPPVTRPTFRPTQPNLIHELNHLYKNGHMDSSRCDCVVCSHKKLMERSLIKVDPVLYNSLNCLRLNKPVIPTVVPQITPLVPHLSSGISNGSTIKYCMYCGNYIPHIQNLLNHIQSEHIDQMSSNFQPKRYDVNFENHLQLPEIKNKDLLKHLQTLYDGEHGYDQGVDKSLLMR